MKDRPGLYAYEIGKGDQRGKETFALGLGSLAKFQPWRRGRRRQEGKSINHQLVPAPLAKMDLQ
jgi:hypothetical protein